jgi:hypothetical protein
MDSSLKTQIERSAALLDVVAMLRHASGDETVGSRIEQRILMRELSGIASFGLAEPGAKSMADNESSLL